MHDLGMRTPGPDDPVTASPAALPVTARATETAGTCRERPLAAESRGRP